MAKLVQYGIDWEVANAAGDVDGMIDANLGANEIRAKYGYDGGKDGKTITILPTAKSSKEARAVIQRDLSILNSAGLQQIQLLTTQYYATTDSKKREAILIEAARVRLTDCYQINSKNPTAIPAADEIQVRAIMDAALDKLAKTDSTLTSAQWDEILKHAPLGGVAKDTSVANSVSLTYAGTIAKAEYSAPINIYGMSYPASVRTSVSANNEFWNHSEIFSNASYNMSWNWDSSKLALATSQMAWELTYTGAKDVTRFNSNQTTLLKHLSAAGVRGDLTQTIQTVMVRNGQPNFDRNQMLSAAQFNSIVSYYEGRPDWLKATDWLVSALDLTSTITAAVYYGVGVIEIKRHQPGQQVEKSECFIAGTIIATSFGSKSIEEINAGDLVYSKDENTGEQGYKAVVRTFIRETNELVHISVDGQMITTTQEHPFYVPKKGWTNALQLRAGDLLVLTDGDYVVVEQVQHEICEAPVKVYNFEVAEWHTYFVSDSGVWVHNADCSGDENPNGTYENARYHGKTGNSVKSKAPSNGQAALDNSVPISAETTPRRIGISNGEIVVLDQTLNGTYHGHVRSWNGLTQPMKNALIDAGMATRKGKIK
jgi:hypothetical protein